MTQKVHLASSLHTNLVLHRPWFNIAIDILLYLWHLSEQHTKLFITGIPVLEGNNMILTIIDFLDLD